MSTTEDVGDGSDGGDDDGSGDDGGDSNDAPETRLIEMERDEAFKMPSGYDGGGTAETGKPIMDKTIVGFKALAGQRFLVETNTVVASGGAVYHKIWIGENDNVAPRGWHVAKDRSFLVV